MRKRRITLFPSGAVTAFTGGFWQRIYRRNDLASVAVRLIVHLRDIPVSVQILVVFVHYDHLHR
jgi:hypothetical protein